MEQQAGSTNDERGGILMKYLSLAVCSLGIWVLLGSFVSGQWVGIVFGALAAVLALIGAFSNNNK